LDAEISAQMEPRPRFTKRFRAIPYIITGFAVASEYRGVPMRVAVEGDAFRTRALVVIASNIQLYGAYLNIAPQACMDDGVLDIFVFKGLDFSYMLRHLARFFSGHHRDNPELTHLVTRTLRIDTMPEVAVQLDGDPFGTTPVQLDLVPGVLRLLAPPNAPNSLFSKPPESW
jgi:diacylglycerol kinase (ATP)